MAFKSGDKVVRMFNARTPYWHRVVAGRGPADMVLTVRTCDTEEISFHEMPSLFDATRFELALVKKKKSGIQSWFKRLDNARIL